VSLNGSIIGAGSLFINPSDDDDGFDHDVDENRDEDINSTRGFAEAMITAGNCSGCPMNLKGPGFMPETW
jgi:hypothetical protein